MAKLKRFSFSSKSQPTPDIAAAAATTLSSSVSSSSSWLAGSPPLIFDDHIGGGVSSAGVAGAAADSLILVGDGDESGGGWHANDDGRVSPPASDQLDELREDGGVEGDKAHVDGDDNGDDNDNGHGKVVVRGCMGDLCLKLVDDCGGSSSGMGCSAEVLCRITHFVV